MILLEDVGQSITTLIELARPLMLLGLASLPLVGCYFLIKLFFQNVNRSTPESVRHLLQSELEEKRYAELSRDTEALVTREQVLVQMRRGLETEKAYLAEEQVQEQAAIAAKIEEREKEITELRERIDKKKNTFREEARQYGVTMLKDFTSQGLVLSTKESRSLVVQYATVIIVIASLLTLSVLELVTAEQAIPILAAIAGYVLGKTSSEPS